ncbi:MAG TPA: hypothetical protein VNO33_15755 [Kofleriaceae bacterium]|nr:hypothetical protein [Kofleriaceae bacterium]
MTEHLSDTEIEEFVLGQLAAARLDSFEAHASACEECAGRLAREARLELALIEVRAARPRPAVTRRAAAVATLVLAAAVLLLYLRVGDDSPERARSIPNVICPDGPDQASCVASAQGRGLFVQYPDWAGPPPFTARASAGPTVAPFPVSYEPVR